jgi:hypothetical protein
MMAKRKDGEKIPITLIVDSYKKNNHCIFIAVLRLVTPELDMQKQLQTSKDAFLNTMSHEV